ncbi:hypothetical protein LEP1GSC202_0614 [Leptospira yanagawae serovar Saopaulo str. Sao Paulo = ATCC 700523]|uniref:Uncharacterized protein n=1 Tax=Leptospira yanagawae serovar Saopaulo str. Sao Paulo = ATCC 700523 TaxID=1249483 RepID=A0A5E8HFD5_9LEPT|nr:hypothetical protein LEP1GSC202_0614 [Leptospira yanagawae serovar Saopaulo str. Sao Paulo = ATCC 700523]
MELHHTIQLVSDLISEIIFMTVSFTLHGSVLQTKGMAK